MKDQGIVVAAILLGAWAGHYFKLPSGILTGGMIAGLVAKGVVLADIPSGNLLSTISQLLVAYVVVSNSDVASIRRHPEAVPLAVGYIFVLIVFCMIAAWGISRWFDLDLQTAIYATAPGGLAGMALSATDAGAETPVSMMFHLLRLTIILIVTPYLAAFFTR
jgi:hypothetical protein